MAPRGSHDTHARTLLKTEPRAPAADVERRFKERDQRLAMDSRTEAERGGSAIRRWIGPRCRLQNSALIKIGEHDDLAAKFVRTTSLISPETFGRRLGNCSRVQII
jgi:hypothetical protein